MIGHVFEAQNCRLNMILCVLTVAALKVNETLKELYLADNKLLPSDGIQLGSLLRYNRTLHLLDLRNNHLQVGPGVVASSIVKSVLENIV